MTYPLSMTPDEVKKAIVECLATFSEGMTHSDRLLLAFIAQREVERMEAGKPPVCTCKNGKLDHECPSWKARRFCP